MFRINLNKVHTGVKKLALGQRERHTPKTENFVFQFPPRPTAFYFPLFVFIKDYHELIFLQSVHLRLGLFI